MTLRTSFESELAIAMLGAPQPVTCHSPERAPEWYALPMGDLLAPLTRYGRPKDRLGATAKAMVLERAAELLEEYGHIRGSLGSPYDGGFCVLGATYYAHEELTGDLNLPYVVRSESDISHMYFGRTGWLGFTLAMRNDFFPRVFGGKRWAQRKLRSRARLARWGLRG